jgi:copper oxidase (laccase) domain-containing protein
VAAQAGVARERNAQGRQVHGAQVRRVTAPPHGAPPDADGQATALAGVAPVVLVADCLPIALVAREAVAMLHAGWRGLAGGIVGEGVAALRELGAGAFGAAIGPGAGPCC